MTIIYLIRHGESVRNVMNEVQLEDSFVNGLTVGGKAQIKAIAEDLRHITFDKLYTSSLLRARESADIIASVLHLSPIVVEALKEKVKGTIPLMKITEHLKAYGEWDSLTEEARWQAKLVPDEESMLELYTRGKNVLSELAQSNPQKTILCVTHGGFMRSIYTKLINGTLKDLWKFYNGGHMVLEVDGETMFLRESKGVRRVSRDYHDK